MDYIRREASNHEMSSRQIRLVSLLKSLASDLESQPISECDLTAIEADTRELKSFVEKIRREDAMEEPPVRITQILAKIGSPAHKHIKHSPLEALTAGNGTISPLSHRPRYVTPIHSERNEVGTIGRSPSMTTPKSASSLNFWRRKDSNHVVRLTAASRDGLSELRTTSPNDFRNIEASLSKVVSELLLRQEEAKNIAILATHTASNSASECANLKSANHKLRQSLTTATSGFRVLTARTDNLERRIRDLDADNPTVSSSVGNDTEKLRQNVQEWWTNYGSILKQMCRDASSQTSAGRESPGGMSSWDDANDADDGIMNDSERLDDWDELHPEDEDDWMETSASFVDH